MKDVTMKLNVLLIFSATLCALGMIHVSAATQKDRTPFKSVTREIGYDLNTVNDSGITWSLHEPFKNCIPCHGNQPEKNSLSEPQLIEPVPKLCYSCHKDLTAKGEWPHGPVATGECLLCHEPHKADNKSLLKKPIPELCYQCHEIDTLSLVANHTDESYARCNDCHEDHTSLSRKLLKQNFFKSEAGQAYISKNPSALPVPVLTDRRGSLVGLRGVKIVLNIDGLELIKRHGISEDFIRTKVEQQLQKSGIKILPDEEQTERQPSLNVQLRLMDVPSNRNQRQVEALSGSFDLSLRQKVELLPIPGNGRRRYCTATTWNTDAILIWSISQVEEGLTEAVEVLVGRFCKDYTAANPPKK